MCTLTNLRGEKPILADLRTQSRHFETRHSLMRGKSGNLKQQGQSVVIAEDVQKLSTPNTEGVPHPPLRSVVGVWGGAGKL